MNLDTNTDAELPYSGTGYRLLPHPPGLAVLAAEANSITFIGPQGDWRTRSV